MMIESIKNLTDGKKTHTGIVMAFVALLMLLGLEESEARDISAGILGSLGALLGHYGRIVAKL